jgi:hypothetical protein
MSLRTRLQRLERNRVDAGCPACRDRRGRIVFRTAEPLPDGTLVWDQDEPQPCKRCGQISEQVIEAIVSVVESPTGSR